MLNILKHLKGEAETWCKHKIDLWENEEIFVMDFKNKYWLFIKQKDFENKLMGRGDFDATKQDLSTYEMDYYHTAAYLNHPFDIQVFIDFISRHLPYNI